jgi:hypothetical protein
MDEAQNAGTLNDVSEAIRTPETRRLLEKLDETLGDPAFQVDPNVGMAPVFREIVSGLARARKLFHADLFFVVIFGALKSGKSTLTNALVEAEISPMGYGRDTTQRPCLILRGTENKCAQFFLRRTSRQSTAGESPNSNEDERAKAFNLVSDYLKGVADLDALKANVEVKPFPFDRGELDKKLTSRVDSPELEPLITVVWVTTGSFLGRSICLIDMPGLDSIEHNAEADSIHYWVIKNADFFLFLQSSIAALNERTQQFLKEIRNSDKQQPMWALQNVMDARHWRNLEERQQEWLAQHNDAVEKVRRIITNGQLKSACVNLGLEWDGIEQKNEDWRSRSLFAEFKSAATQQLTNERGLIKERNCINDLAASVRGGLDKIARIREDQGHILNECRAVEYAAKQELPAEISKLTYFTEARLKEVRISLSGHLDARYSHFKTNIEAKSKDRRTRARQMKKGELETARTEYLADLKKLAQETFAFEGEFRVHLDSTIRDRMEAANNDPALAGLENLWKKVDQNFSLLADLKQLSAPELSQLNCDIEVPLPPLSNYVRGLQLLDNVAPSVFNADVVAGIIDEVTEGFTRKLTERFESWKLNMADPFKNFDATRREWLKAKAEAESAAILARLAPSKQAAELAIQKCNAIQQAIGNLEPLLDSARISF